jgi:hypothetical protein
MNVIFKMMMDDVFIIAGKHHKKFILCMDKKNDSGMICCIRFPALSGNGMQYNKKGLS